MHRIITNVIKIILRVGVCEMHLTLSEDLDAIFGISHCAYANTLFHNAKKKKIPEAPDTPGSKHFR